MNFGAGKGYSIVLMSQRKGAPYPDRLAADGTALLYVGHDAYGHPHKGTVDQPLATLFGTLTQNGLFFQAAESYRQSGIPHLVRVYEKIRAGVWVFNGLFELTDASMESDGKRRVCVFELRITSRSFDDATLPTQPQPSRLIPSEVKVKVFRRDHGKCRRCGATTDLHFDHILPYSKGGSSTNPDNIQLLCQRHNLEKRDRIE
ncbi:MAG: HNH endonuclease [Fimbriimonas ginsengisoli]|uniref:HNH endonuclease n=1 Tax=Fimbriimonas ginsengisoli TaxID=1005039 RepID=A0A931LYF6_FIMGI|nr:HNH endonuclease [Fimbriimonas ginsengisoli]MBI3744684.1 HNH endonuclease [Chloroflexota bacterium]